MQHRIFQVRESAWEMFSKPGYTKPFSLSYLGDNLEHAVAFFFAKATSQPNSHVLSALGVLAVVLFAVVLARRLRKLTRWSNTAACC